MEKTFEEYGRLQGVRLIAIEMKIWVKQTKTYSSRLRALHGHGLLKTKLLREIEILCGEEGVKVE